MMKTIEKIVQSVLKAVALAMGIAVIVLSCMNVINADSATLMLGMGLACLTVTQFFKRLI